MVIRKGDIMVWMGVASIHFVPAIVTQTTKIKSLSRRHFPGRPPRDASHLNLHVRWFDRPGETPYGYNDMEVIRLYCSGGKLF